MVVKHRDIFEGVAEITGHLAGDTDWNDSNLIGMRAIILTPLETQEEIRREVSIMCNGLMNKVTERTAAAVMLLAWNMRATTYSRIYPDRDPGAGLDDAAVSALEEQGTDYVSGSSNALINKVTDHRELVRAAAFMAASMLKMFAKRSSSWMLAWTNGHIQRRYREFNGVDFPLKEISPTLETATELMDMFQKKRLFIGTLGRIISAACVLEDKRQQEMLFLRHLSCTGMHIIPQFINAKMGLDCPTGDLLNALYTSRNVGTLTQLRNLIDSSLSERESETNLGTWRYARLFNPKAYGFLQSNYCRDTLCILAYINQMCQASTKAGDPLQIEVIKQMTMEKRRYAHAVAANIHKYFTVTKKAEVVAEVAAELV